MFFIHPPCRAYPNSTAVTIGCMRGEDDVYFHSDDANATFIPFPTDPLMFVPCRKLKSIYIFIPFSIIVSRILNFIRLPLYVIPSYPFLILPTIKPEDKSSSPSLHIQKQESVSIMLNETAAYKRGMRHKKLLSHHTQLQLHQQLELARSKTWQTSTRWVRMHLAS